MQIMYMHMAAHSQTWRQPLYEPLIARIFPQSTDNALRKIHQKYVKSEFPIVIGFWILQFVYIIWYIGLDL